MENREKQPVLKVENLSISFDRYDRGMKRRELGSGLFLGFSI